MWRFVHGSLSIDMAYHKDMMGVVLGIYQDQLSEVDEEGRLPLHYAAMFPDVGFRSEGGGQEDDEETNGNAGEADIVNEDNINENDVEEEEEEEEDLMILDGPPEVDHNVGGVLQDDQVAEPNAEDDEENPFPPLLHDNNEPPENAPPDNDPPDNDLLNNGPPENDQFHNNALENDLPENDPPGNTVSSPLTPSTSIYRSRMDMVLQMNTHACAAIDHVGRTPLHYACAARWLPQQSSTNVTTPCAISLLVAARPSSASLPDGHNRLPLHLALGRGGRTWTTGIRPLVSASPQSVFVPDALSRLFPFMMAAAADYAGKACLNTAYELLLGAPNLVQGGVKEHESERRLRRKIEELVREKEELEQMIKRKRVEK
eukprot:CAMPEP_0113327140 /NCGR_PEP_ID=MMETSP0010_2-20120614/19068_1 /TAXON_ID=216773 ORGANISM="Corethron hystrix, Strain 308" /NCGR_SAMPLE_ID=MMETSP0010_2 /ASSEMBLY_ACC=CAM_ASM_000155 /LENGTH=372 /DNA_ID=CAMNT_0000187863 /DNA_START=1 /DNA_END=1119 /DNA_ORIENTATION=+ /assembly_acc=CAM_ASM_000155